ncbi:MAG TPA: hypothetical protein VLL08_31480 [Kineosporiaceae bacterium]|nr:hypothetical protein [Kineosporiaceae bacterium]
MSEPTGYHLKEVERLLAEDDRTSELQIHLGVIAGRLVVRGRVASPERRDRVLQLIRQHCPDLPIDDELDTDEQTLTKSPATSEEIA